MRKVAGSVWGFIKRHKKAVIFLVIVAIIGGVVLSYVNKIQQAAANFVMLPETTALQKMDLERLVTGSGTVQSAKGREVTSALSTEISAVHVNEGDYVNAGDTLCTLDTTDLDEDIRQAEQDLSKARASDNLSLQQAQRRLAEAEEQYSIDEESHKKKIEQAEQAITDARIAAGTAAGNAAIEGGAVAAAMAGSAGQAAAVTTAQSNCNKAAATLAGKQAALSEKQNTLSLKQSEYEAALSGNASNLSTFETARNTTQGEVDTAQGEVTKATTALKNAQDANTAAYNAAYEAYKASNQSVYDNAYNDAYNNANVTALQQAYDTAVETRDTVLRNDISSIQTAKDSLASQKLVDTTTQHKDNLKKLKQDKEDSTITAPISGTIVEMTAEVGLTPSSSVAGGVGSGSGSGTGTATALFTIKDTAAMEIPISVPEYDAVIVEENMPVTITSDALDDAEWQGLVTSVSPAATDENGNFTVTVLITSSPRQLALGMTAQLNIVTQQKPNVYAVPYDAVTQNAAGQTIVYEYVTGASAGGVPQGMSMPEDFSAPADFSMPEGAAPPAGAAGMQVSAGGTMDAGSASATTWREIPVTTGMETDYYVEISGDGLTDGMAIISDPEGKNAAAGDPFMMSGTATAVRMG